MMKNFEIGKLYLEDYYRCNCVSQSQIDNCIMYMSILMIFTSVFLKYYFLSLVSQYFLNYCIGSFSWCFIMVLLSHVASIKACNISAINMDNELCGMEVIEKDETRLVKIVQLYNKLSMMIFISSMTIMMVFALIVA